MPKELNERRILSALVAASSAAGAPACWLVLPVLGANPRQVAGAVVLLLLTFACSVIVGLWDLWTA